MKSRRWRRRSRSINSRYVIYPASSFFPLSVRPRAPLYSQHANAHQLETVQLGLQADPSNAELVELKNELEQVISLSQSSIDELRPPTTVPSKPAPPAQPPSEKWKREDHPKFRGEAPREDEAPEKVSFQVNDTVLAKWHSGDKGFYPARITSITGSSGDPVYIVRFKNYDTVETLRSRDIKPVSSKRKAEAVSAPLPGPATAQRQEAGVISAGPDIDAEAKARREREAKGALGEEKERKPKKIKASKELEKGKMKWQDWAAKGAGKKGGAVKKESMFRTPEGVHGRGMLLSFPFSFFLHEGSGLATVIRT